MKTHIQTNLLEDRYIPEPNSGCWLWEGALADGYGSMRYKGKVRRSHRVSYEIHKGLIPEGLYVLHSCDVRCCINPAHLRIGTQSENAQDMYDRGRGYIASGSKSTRAILSETKVLEIRSKFKPRIYTTGDLALEYNVSTSTIEKILSRKLWKHI